MQAATATIRERFMWALNTLARQRLRQTRTDALQITVNLALRGGREAAHVGPCYSFETFTAFGPLGPASSS
jgi:hypothetical protein